MQLLTQAVLVAQGPNLILSPRLALTLVVTPNTHSQLHYLEEFGHDEMLRGFHPQRSPSFSRGCSCHHNAHARNKYSKRQSSHCGIKVIHRSCYSTPETSNSLEPYKYRSRKQPIREYMHEDVYTPHEI